VPGEAVDVHQQEGGQSQGRVLRMVELGARLRPKSKTSNPSTRDQTRGVRAEISLVLLAWTILLAGCSSQPNVANLDSRGTTIVCFGNSLTQGEGASMGHEYPSLLASALGREVINAGVGGNTTRDALQRLDADVLSHNPRLVIVEFGGNDFLQHLPREEIFRNLDTIVERIQAQGAMVVLLGVRPGLFGDATRSDYRRIAKSRRAVFVPDILEGIFTEPRFKSDEIHPNDLGYARIAERVLKVVQPLLEGGNAM